MTKIKTATQKYWAKLKRKRKEADKLWQELIVKFHPICEGCLKQKSVVGHHFIRKSDSNFLRYSVNNGIGLCAKCHYRLHTQSDGEVYANIVMGRNNKWLEYIKKYRTQSTKTNLAFYETHIKLLTQALNE